MARLVRVEMVDRDGAPIATTSISADQLPETFELETTLHLPDGDWIVLRAEPPRRAEFERTGQLRLTMQRVELVDPHELLFSLPTICDVLPEVRSAPPPGVLTFDLHEDDWRQVEMVVRGHERLVLEEFEAIRAIRRDQSVPSGMAFRAVHVRERIAEPLSGCRITLDELATSVSMGPRALTIGGATVDGGFAYCNDSACVYGIVRHYVEVLALRGWGSDQLQGLAALMDAYELLLVDWCGATRTTAADLRRLLTTH